MYNQMLDFQSGYLAALSECLEMLTENPEGRTEAYEETLDWIRGVLG